MLNVCQEIRTHAANRSPSPKRTGPDNGPGLKKSTLVVAALLTFVAAAAKAQTAPDAGSLLQQIEQQRKLKLPPERPAAPATPLAELQNLSGPSVTLTNIRVAGNRLLSQEQLAPVLAPFLNRPVVFSEMQQAAAAVAKAYRDAGWIARAYLPKQEITQGELIVQVIEASFGGVQWSGEAATRVARARVERFVDAGIAKGAPISVPALDRILLLLDDLPGIATQGSLAAGAAEGETALALSIVDRPLLASDLSIDNGGSRSTGSQRYSVNVAFASPARIADSATLSAIHTEGSDYLRAAYSLPLGSQGWRLGANVTGLRYTVQSPEATGSSTSYGLDASYPLLRSPKENVYVQIAHDRKSFHNLVASETSSKYRIAVTTVGVSANRFDAFGGGGASSASLAWVGGTVNLNGSPNEDADQSTTRTGGTFGKLRYSASRLQGIAPGQVASLAISGQLANKNLDSSEKIFLGGSTGVRAYPSSEGGGSDGVLANLEWRFSLPASLGLTAFYDWGQVVVNHDNDFTGAAKVNRISLKGAGLSFGWQGPVGMSVRVTWARRIGSNPSPTAAGLDQDGTLVRNRFWLQAGLAL
jgi:hemolysin activation/secretion protein